MRTRIRECLWLLVLSAFLAGCASNNVRGPASDGGAGGVTGQRGDAGGDGQAGSTNASEWYARYPLCQTAQLIVSTNDLSKLDEFLRAGCSVVVAGKPGSTASLYELAVAYQKIDILEVILRRADLRGAIDLYSPLRSVFPLHHLKMDLNPFEVAIYSRLLKTLESNVDESVFRRLDVDPRQLKMLQLLLSAATDVSKLGLATARALENLKSSDDAGSPGVQGAISAIESRLQSLGG